MTSLYNHTMEYYPKSWQDFFTSKNKIVKCVSDVIDKEIREGKFVLPPIHFVWNAFLHTGAQNVKVVILGQDPYPKPGDAMGLAFSVRKKIEIPPSLCNIYKVLHKTVPGFSIPDHGDLTEWAVQGVLLVNTANTIVAHEKNSHARPWQQFTSALIEYLSDKYSNLVFLLWGAQAQGYRKWIDKRRHLVLETSHPSPMSYDRGFKDCNHFNEANDYLSKNGKQVIDWNLPCDEE